MAATIPPSTGYPGVYVQELPGDASRITPVDTAITAFLGRALRGPLQEPVPCASFADFERIFGGLWLDQPLGYAVADFFLNGGAKAIVVRIESAAAMPVAATLSCGPISMTAKNPGAWGNALRARIIAVDPGVAQEVSQRSGAGAAELFTLEVHDGTTGVTETFANVTLDSGTQRVDQVIAAGSVLVTAVVAPATPADPAPRKAPEPAPAEGAVAWESTDPSIASASGGADGGALDPLTDLLGNQQAQTGIYALERANLINLLYLPGAENKTLHDTAAAYCKTRRAMLILDSPKSWTSVEKAVGNLGDVITPSENAALYFPRILKPNPKRSGQVEEFGAGGCVAGIMAATDAARGVWKAPAGVEASLAGATGLSVVLDDAQNGQLNPQGINCLRSLPSAGLVVWGARTTVGDDQLASDWKYVPVRRLTLFIEESVYRGTQWAVFEPNSEPLWSSLRLSVVEFMNGLFVQGAFQGSAPADAYFVQCDSTTTTPADIDQGIVNIVIGFAAVHPAEFIVIQIQQITGQSAA